MYQRCVNGLNEDRKEAEVVGLLHFFFFYTMPFCRSSLLSSFLALFSCFLSVYFSPPLVVFSRSLSISLSGHLCVFFISVALVSFLSRVLSLPLSFSHWTAGLETRRKGGEPNSKRERATARNAWQCHLHYNFLRPPPQR